LRAFRLTGASLDVEEVRGSTASVNGREQSAAASRANSQVDECRLSHDDGNHRPALNRRRYDWTPRPIDGAREAHVEQRLRRWREVDAVVDQRLQSAIRSQGRDSLLVPAPAPARTVSTSVEAAGPVSNAVSVKVGRDGRSDLARRRYDWTPAPADADAIVRGTRPRIRDRER
jgi:hypothetical protein